MTSTISAPEALAVTLYYSEGSSDKVYQASIEPVGELFVVNFAYGRRGTTLQSGTKTPVPVEYVTAAGIYHKLVGEKMAKGYTEGPNQTPYSHTRNEKRNTGITPQLLNPVENSEVERLIVDNRYCAQEKFDGRRLLIRKTGEQVQAINRKGLLTDLPESLIHAAQAIPGDFLIDGECVGEILYSFDILEGPGCDVRERSYQIRLVSLMNLLGLAMQRNIRLVETAFAQTQKRDLLATLRRRNKEGIVFKRLDAHYTAGRPNSGGPQLKYKFVQTCSCVVAGVNDKRSVELRLLGADGWMPCGNVSIPVNSSIPQVGQVVEVRYLYAFRQSNALFQPVYIGTRADIEMHECVISQLKFKEEQED